jgi:hypothetical protein
MLRKKTWQWGGLLSVTGLAAYLAWGALTPAISYNRDIRPIINKNCIACHGGVKKSGGISFLFPEEAYAKGKSGRPAIVPGDPGASEMIRRITSHDPEKRMPLDGQPLSATEIDLLKDWISQGAKWEDHWAYLPPKLPEVPTAGKDWATHPIDHFVAKKLAEQQLSAAPEADRRTLIRRASLDLTGLPPSPEQVAKFLADQSPRAYEQMLDELLASPAYGERWAGMWLDMARYADSKGYEKDSHRNIWAFRDYVIKSFNDDKPFDQFTTEQLAGDLLPNPTEEQLIATAFHRNTMNNDEGGTDDEEFRTAEILDRVNTTWDVWQGTSFSCIQCHSHPYDPIRHEEYYKYLAFFNNTQDTDRPDDLPVLRTYADSDRVKMAEVIEWIEKNEQQQTQPSIFQKTRREGSQPPAQQVLANTRTHYGLSELARRRREALLPKLDAQEFDEYERVQARFGALGYIRHNSFVMYRGLDLTKVNNIGIEYFSNTTGGEVEARLGKLDGPLLGMARLPMNDPEVNLWNPATISWAKVSTNIAPQPGRHDVYFVFKCEKTKYNNTMRNDSGDEYTGPFQIKYFYLNETDRSWANLAKPLAQMKDSLTKFKVITTPILRELPADRARQSKVFVRGNWMTPGQAVSPDVPQSLGGLKGRPANRLGLAQWIHSPDNSLTSRVLVNRFWEQVFGVGIVETLEDLGSQGAKPSHPELLDWLAVQFQTEYKWSVKRLLKEILLSATYRQSSVATPEALERDPANHYLSHAPRVRMSAEQLRDQSLAVSGLLSKKMYGPSVMPPQPEGVWQVVYNGSRWQTSQGEDRYRRALYTYWRRSSPYPSLIAYDAPSREFCVSRRIRTNTPLQALVSLNDTVSLENARFLAKRALAATPSGQADQVVQRAYEMALVRQPNPKALASLMQLYQKSLADFGKNPEGAASLSGFAKDKPAELAAYTLVCNAIMNLDAFVVKD